MSATVTDQGLSSWGDFSVPTVKTFTLNSTVAAGHHLFLALASTVDNNSVPSSDPASGYGAICVFGSDSGGNVWTREAYGSFPDHSGFGSLSTTCELWRTGPLAAPLASGFTSTITPATRGLSAYYELFDVAGITSAPFDKTQSSGGTNSGANTWQAAGTNFVPGTTAALAQADELVVVVFAGGSIAGLPASNWITPAVVSPVWNVLVSVHGSDPGSDRGLHVMYREVNDASGQAGVGTVGGGGSTGAALIATYKVGGAAAAPERTLIGSGV